MKILMLGWEFAPYITGGLGRACEKIASGLLELGHSVDFVAPSGACPPARDRFRYFSAPVAEPLSSAAGAAYAMALPSPYLAQDPGADGELFNPYSGNLLQAVENYARWVCEEFAGTHYDAIHAHDWPTFPAAEALARKLGVPFIAHFHSLEQDRNPRNPSPAITALERLAVEKASLVIAVSELTRRCLETHYGLAESGARVVHNGTDSFRAGAAPFAKEARTGSPEVLFVGRLTYQKGISYLGSIVKEVLAEVPGARFIVAGAGDMKEELQRYLERHALESSVSLVGFLQDAEVSAAYRRADVLIMPSVSEPFGLVATEAVEHGIPTVLSCNSGAAELMPSAFRASPAEPVRFAGLVSLLLRNPEIGASVVRQSRAELASHTWRRTARRISEAYQAVACS